MAKDSLNWKVAGPAGQGIMSTGLIFSKTCVRHGLDIFDYPEYPSIITGGHNTYQVLAAVDKAHCQKRHLDVLVALDEATLGLHLAELDQSSIVLFDSKNGQVDAKKYNLPAHIFDIPFSQIAIEQSKNALMANNVALGASIYLLGLDLALLNAVIADIFADKGAEIIALNQKAALAGHEFIKNLDQQSTELEQINLQTATVGKNKASLTGNEAIALGALAGGLQFYAAYPMTPSSSVLHTLAAQAKQADIVVKHAEDEISAINMALGSAYGGARSMTGTSGGGFCYMTEALGLAGVAELPLVVLNSMRPGPALGMPTWTAQGDLLMAITASQDEFPRFVLAPADATEAFELSRRAQELAEKYQTLVIILADKYLSESRYVLNLESEQFSNQRFAFANPSSNQNKFFARYQITETGITQRFVPGQVGGTHIANSYEHDEWGFATEEAAVRVAQNNKRFAKLSSMIKEIPPQFYADQQAELTLISFGSTRGVLLEAQKLLNQENIKVNILNLSWLWPFPVEQVKQVLKPASPAGRSKVESSKVITVEGNSQGQLSKLITQETGIKIQNQILKYDGRPFYAEDLVEQIKHA